MAYAELIHRLFHVNLFGGMKLGLQNAQLLQKLFHYPDRSFISIHVAGTNGKGSVCTKIASAFQEAGYRVGLYTSPHISCFRERIKINGKMIAEEQVESLLTSLFHVIETAQIPATFFEITTFLAFLYFNQEQVDIAVIETGLGGRLDATNVIHPCLSIITSISLDHTEILGSSREEIALEKGGIIKENVPVVIGPHVPLSPIQAITSSRQSLCLPVTSISSLFEDENRSIALAALNYLAPHFKLSAQDIKKGLESCQPCRFQILQGPPLVILDAAHNPDGLQHLFEAITQQYKNCSLRLLFGLSKTKNLLECSRVIAQYGTHFHLVQASNGRGALTEVLASHLHNLSIDSACIFKGNSIFDEVKNAKQEALKYGQALVIFGSFFIMGEARQALGFDEPTDAIDLNERLFPTKCLCT